MKDKDSITIGEHSGEDQKAETQEVGRIWESY